MQSRCKYCQSDIVVDVRITRASQRHGKCPKCGREFFLIANDQSQPVRIIFEDDGKGLYERACTRCGNLFRTDSLRDIPICNNCKTGEFVLDTATDQWTQRQRDSRTSERVIDNSRPLPKSPLPKPIKETTIKPRRNFRRHLAKIGRFFKWLLIFSLVGAMGFIVWRKLPKSFFAVNKQPASAAPKVRDAAFEERQLLAEIESEILPFVGSKNVGQSAAGDLSKVDLLLDKDQPGSYAEAVLLAKQSLVATHSGERFNENDVLALSYLAEATAYLIRHHRQEKLERRALLLSDIAFRLQANSPHALRARAAALLFAGDKGLAKQLLEGVPATTMRMTPRLGLYLELSRLAVDADKIDTNNNNATWLKASNDLLALQGEAPQLLELTTVLTQVYLQRNELTQARKAAEGRLKLDGGAPGTFLQLGIIGARQNDFQTAVKYFQQLLRNDPTYVDARLRLASIYYAQLKQYDNAERHLQDVVKRYEKYTDESQRKLAYYHLGNIAFVRKKYAAAIEHYSSALKISPYFVAAIVQRGASYLKVANEGAARQDMQLGVQIAPNRLATVLPLARLLATQQLQSEALRVLTDAAATTPSSLLLLMEQVHVYVEQGLYGEAERLIQHALNEVKVVDERAKFGLGAIFGLPIPTAEEGIYFDEWDVYRKDLLLLRAKQPESNVVETFIGNLQAAGLIKIKGVA